MAAIGDENIRGLDVPVNDAFRMRGVKRVGDFGAQIQHHIQRQRAPSDAIAQRLTLQILHDDEKLSIVLANLMDCADVRMVKSGSGASFPLKTLERLTVRGHILGKKLQRNKAPKLGVFGLVHDAHSAPAEFFDDAVVRNGRTDEGGGFGHRGILGCADTQVNAQASTTGYSDSGFDCPTA